MIVIIVIRRALCETCGKTFDLEWGEEPPDKCQLCGSVNWEVPPEIRDATYIRKGISKSKRRLNPGAASRARQQQGKRQWQAFKPKPEGKVGDAK